MAVLAAVECRPRPLADLVRATGLSRATAYRLAVALERTARAPGRRGPLRVGAAPDRPGPRGRRGDPGWLHARLLAWLQEQTGESVQLFVRDGDVRKSVESLEAPHELRTIVPVGARLPLDRGSGGRGCARVRGAAGGHGLVESVAERCARRGPVSAPWSTRRTGSRFACERERPHRPPRSLGRRHGPAVEEAASSHSPGPPLT